MNDKLIARRQKDLEGYTDRLQLELENMVGPYMKDLAPAWQRMTDRLEKKIENLYKQAGALTDPTKIQALQNEAQRLAMLQASLAADLKHMEARLQPYYTGMLKHQFEKSYYLNAFGLEQAGRLSVQVPVLTQSQVLGVLANPWLPDGANYAARLGRNTAYLAEKMRGAVAEAVSEGWGISKTAQRIRDVAGEGLSNAVRLARTELNRASSLGASYCYMQNADVLDGKRWNATLDSRTAPKDADNDGEIYDLDYDTPENEGLPGERIPNHPNCRCKYSPVLSALGVRQRERIARGKGDSTTEYGERTYTEAKTYREYAKAKGLPDLDDRLARDNLKAYLRPGETVADLNKTVVRWKPPVGPEVVVPKPIWEQAKADPTVALKTFKPAKTLEEAQRYALENGVPIVDYSKMSLEHANALNAAIDTLPEGVRPKGVTDASQAWKSVGIKPTRKATEYYGVTINTPGDIKLAGKFDFNGGNVVGINTHQFKTIQAMTDQKQAVQGLYVKRTGRKWFFNDTGLTTAAHEMGHVYENIRGLPDGWNQLAQRWYNEAQADILKSASEAFAEAWGAYHTGRGNLLPDYIKDVIGGLK